MKLDRPGSGRFSITRIICAALLLIAFVGSQYRNDTLAQPSVTQVTSKANPKSQSKSADRPKEGYVPDAETAIKIAEAIWTPLYGQKNIEGEKPFTASLVNGEWQVQGTLPKDAVGGTAFASISKDTGCIGVVFHTK